jgi:hypothetical protein
MKTIYTLIALLMALVLAVFIFFYESRRMTTDEWQERKHYVFNIKAADISKMRIENRYGKFHLEKKGNLWKITAPLKARADKTIIESIISKLENMKTKRKFKLEKDKDYGTGRPRVKFYFGSAGKQKEVSFGNISLDKKYIYIRIDKDDEIQVVDKDIFKKINKDITAFRYKKVLDFKRYNITKIELTRVGRSMVFERDKEHNWRITSPILYKANNFKCDEMLDKIEKLEVDNFVEDGVREFSRYGLDKPRIAVKFFEEKKVRGIHFGLKKESQIYARRAGNTSVYSVKKDIMDILDKEVVSFRERKIVKLFSMEKVREIKIKEKNKLLSMKKIQNLWKILSPVKTEAAKDKVVQLLEDIRNLRVKEFVDDDLADLNKYGLDNPLRRISLKTDNGFEVINIGFKSKDIYFINTHRFKNVVAVGVPEIDPLFKSYNTYQIKKRK